VTSAGKKSGMHAPTFFFIPSITNYILSFCIFTLYQSLYQPPRAVHCPDCNVCIKGWDHHCPWMGTCIGEKNYTLFLAFNLTWLIYLFFAIVWVLNYPLHDLGPPRGVAPDDDDET
jgi:hypothetical protein